MAKKSEKAQYKPTHGVVSTVVVGPRGQIVIPKEAREWLGVRPGDRMIILSKAHGALVMLRAEGIRELADKLLKMVE